MFVNIYEVPQERSEGMSARWAYSVGTSWDCLWSWPLGHCLPTEMAEPRGSSSLLFQWFQALHYPCHSEGSPFGGFSKVRVIFKKSWLSSQLRSILWSRHILMYLPKSHWSGNMVHILQRKQYNRKMMFILLDPSHFPYIPGTVCKTLWTTYKKQKKQKILQEKTTKQGGKKQCLCVFSNVQSIILP